MHIDSHAHTRGQRKKNYDTQLKSQGPPKRKSRRKISGSPRIEKSNSHTEKGKYTYPGTKKHPSAREGESSGGGKGRTPATPPRVTSARLAPRGKRIQPTSQASQTKRNPRQNVTCTDKRAWGWVRPFQRELGRYLAALHENHAKIDGVVPQSHTVATK